MATDIKPMTNLELASKVEWEGGVAEYVFGYCGGAIRASDYEDQSVASLLSQIATVGPAVDTLSRVLDVVIEAACEAAKQDE